MKHAGPDALAKLDTLLSDLRKREALKENRPGVFYSKSRAFLHFHEDPSGLFCDVKLTHDFVRFPVNTARQRSSLMARIDRVLSRL
jgi:hypothetical protein